MVNSVLITNSSLSRMSGGGVVGLNLKEALQSCSELKLILSNGIYPDNVFDGVRAVSINPRRFKYGEITSEVPTPFFMDYLAYNELGDEKYNLCMTYACCFGLTVEKLKKNGCKVICDLAPHNISLSKEEHIKHHGNYPYPHLTDPYLLKLYLRHLRLADRVVVHSNFSAEYIQKEADIKELPTVIPHGCYIPENIEPLPELFTVGNFGACLSGDMFLFLENGSIKKIKDVEIGDKIWGYDTYYNEQSVETVVDKINRGVKPIYEITTPNRKITATEEHLFLVFRNRRSKYNHHYSWVELKELKKGDSIVVLRELNLEKNRVRIRFSCFGEITCGIMKIIGCYIGDGYHRRNHEFKLYLPETDKFREKYYNLCHEAFGIYPHERYDCLEIGSKKVVNAFKQLGLYGNHKTKVIPNWVFTLRRSYIFAFIEGLIDADGHYENDGKSCTISLANEFLMNQLKMLAIRVGIKTENISYSNIHDKRTKKYYERWKLRLYYDYINGNGAEREERLHLSRLLIDIQNIKDISFAGNEEVFDITTNENHTFYANGVLTHNCGVDKGTNYLLASWLSMFTQDTPFKENYQLWLGGTGAGIPTVKDEWKPLFNFTGHVENVSDFYNGTSIGIYPTITEGFGICILETMAHGRPVIVGRGAGASELVEDGVNGFVVDGRDVNAIKDKITYFYMNPDELKRMGKNASETAKKYSWNIINKKYIEVFEEYI